MITEWHRYCETGNCIETRLVDGQVEIRDTERPEATLLVPAKAWQEYGAALRRAGRDAAIAAIEAEAKFQTEQGRDSLAAVYRMAAKKIAEVRNNEGESRDA